MQIRQKLSISSVLLCTLAFGAQAEQPHDNNPSTHPGNVTAFLLDLGTQVQETELDCTHFVHSLYEQAGIEYPYANSERLYRGAESFRRVSQPKAGDVVVWHGHAGIVVDPEEHTFLSALREGVKTASYDSPYWKSKGHPRFFRHVTLIPSQAISSISSLPARSRTPSKASAFQEAPRQKALQRADPKRIIIVDGQDADDSWHDAAE